MYLKISLPRKFVLFLIACTFVMPSWPFNTPSAMAQEIQFDQQLEYNPFQEGESFQISWEIDVSFIGSNIDAQWIVRVEQQERDGQSILIDEYIQYLECEERGDLQIADGVATFNPQSRDYIVCDISSYRDAVEQLLNATIQTHCDCVDPWLGIDLHIKPNRQRLYPVIYLAAANNSAPVFEAQIRKSRRNRGYFETMMSGWDRVERSRAFNIRRAQTLWSGNNPVRFVHTLAERHERYPSRWTEFWMSTNLAHHLSLVSNRWLSWVDSLGTNQLSVGVDQNTTMYTDEMTLYIGYNPATKQYFRGKMTNIGVDPGCAGFGGR